MLLDRSGQGKVYQLISRRRFQQMEVLEGQNILVTVSGKKNRVRVYYLSWLKSKILRTDGVSDVCMPPGLAFSLILEDKACSSQWKENIKSNTSHEQMVWFHFSLSNVRSWLCLNPFSAWSLSPEFGREQVADVKAIEIANLDLILKSTYYSFTGSG